MLKLRRFHSHKEKWDFPSISKSLVLKGLSSSLFSLSWHIMLYGSIVHISWGRKTQLSRPGDSNSHTHTREHSIQWEFSYPSQCNIMGVMASQITARSTVCSTGFLPEKNKKTKNLHYWAFVRGTTGDRWFPLPKGRWCGICFHIDTSSCFDGLIWNHSWNYHIHCQLGLRKGGSIMQVDPAKCQTTSLICAYESTSNLYNLKPLI